MEAERKEIDLRIAHVQPQLLPLHLFDECSSLLWSELRQDLYRVDDVLGYNMLEGEAYFRSKWAHFIQLLIPTFSCLPTHLVLLPGASFSISFICSQIKELDGRGDYSLEKKNKIGIEDPSYFHVKQIFTDLNLAMVPFPVDRKGLDVSALEQQLAAGLQLKFFYTIPTYHNPTGVSMSTSRKKKLIELSKEYKFGIISDEAYHFLRYSPSSNSPLKFPLVHYDYPPYSVFSVTSFSKICSPGIRMAVVHSQGNNVDSLVECGFLKSGGGFCSLESSIIMKSITSGIFEEHLKQIRGIYSDLCDAAYLTLRLFFPDDQILLFSKPKGGFFIW
eukprot:CAMPEP_0174273562 /NCGR_PEP_ID=MMETSP0439-20130205/54976_1 /TAXON_ID=0 /ORGANISM="Stereomyxa ramosa, Strain Chinc5" /LENGTH=331 /DNA_ID=CAMNT_0015364799 /DNA_START=85 /DNA_END=1077 /DNA_ORIENTATION=+